METGGTASECLGDGSKCAECGKLFSHSFYFGTHIVTHVAEKQFQAVGQCGMCGLVFSDSAIYQSHLTSLNSRLDAMDSETKSIIEDEVEKEQSIARPAVEKEEIDPYNSPPQQAQPPPQPLPAVQAKHEQPRVSSLVENGQQEMPPKQQEHDPSPSSKVTSDVETKSGGESNSTQPELPKSSPPKSSPLDDSQNQNEGKAPVKKEPTAEATSSNSNAVEGDLPRKRVRRAPDKYEVYPEEKKRRVVKRKPSTHTPDSDPEVEKYLQSLRDMGYAVAPDNVDIAPGRQGSRGREPPTKRGRGMARGRGASLASYNQAGAQHRQNFQPQSHRGDFGFRGQMRGAVGGGRGRGGAYQHPQSQGAVSWKTTPPMKDFGPNHSARNSNQNFSSSKSQQGAKFNSGGTPSSYGTTGVTYSKYGVKLRPFATQDTPQQQQYVHKPSTVGMSYAGGGPGTNRFTPMTVPLPPIVPKRKVSYYDEEDEIVNLIKTDMEIMPTSGKATRGERLKQRQDRLSQDGTAVEGGKKAVKYFPKEEKAKAKRSPRKSLTPLKRPRMPSPHGDEMSAEDGTYESYSHSRELDQGKFQMSNVQSLQPTIKRGRPGAWNSSPSSKSQLSSSHQHPPASREYTLATEEGIVRNVEGRMDVLREAARRHVEDMLSSPATFLEQSFNKGPEAAVSSSHSQRGYRFPITHSLRSRGSPKGHAKSSSRGSRRGTRSRGRALLSSRGRGVTMSVSGQRLVTGVENARVLPNSKVRLPTNIVVNLDDEDVEEITSGVPGDGNSEESLGDAGSKVAAECEDDVKETNNKGDDGDKGEVMEGANIDGWTVSISKMSDSEGEENDSKTGDTDANETAQGDKESKGQTLKPTDSLNNSNSKADAVETHEDDDDSSHDGNDKDSEKNSIAKESHATVGDKSSHSDSELEGKSQSSAMDTGDQDSCEFAPLDLGSSVKETGPSGSHSSDRSSDVTFSRDANDTVVPEAETADPNTDVGAAMDIVSVDSDRQQDKVCDDMNTDVANSNANCSVLDQRLGKNIVAEESHENQVISPPHTATVASGNLDPSDSSKNDFSQEIDLILQGKADSGSDVHVNKNNEKQQKQFLSDCSDGFSQGTGKSYTSDNPSSLEKNYEGSTTEEESHSNSKLDKGDDSGYLYNSSSDFNSTKSSSGEMVEESSSSSSLKNNQQNSATSSNSLQVSSEILAIAKGESQNSHEDKSLAENSSVSQRFEPENGYDDANPFSEIEKTCQEIIRDAENHNQEEERRANMECS